MPKRDCWSDDDGQEIELRFRGDDVIGHSIAIEIGCSEFECDPTDAREIGQKLIEMADQFDE